MDNKSYANTDLHLTEQALAAWIARLNEVRRQPLFAALDHLQRDLDRQDRSFSNALVELDWVRERLSSPERILGNDKTKHGEIAEMAEVGLRRAKQVLTQQSPNAYWNEAERLASADYLIAGNPVQSKFINGVNNGLQHILEHANRYPEFGTTDAGYYHIPSDQYEAIQRARNGLASEFNVRTIATINHKVQRIEAVNGRPFDEIVRPASHTYSDVQQGRIYSTLDQHQSDLETISESRKRQLVEQHDDAIQQATGKAAPTVKEVAGTALTGAAVGMGLQLTLGAYQKWQRENITPLQYTVADWHALGDSALHGALTGGVSAAAMYALTNYSALSAPFAGAVVSSGRAIRVLFTQYQQDQLSFDEFADLCLIATIEAGIAAAGASLGQTVIPIPIVGAVIGSSILRVASVHARPLLAGEADLFLDYIDQKLQSQIDNLNRNQRKELARLDAEMLHIGRLMDDAFDERVNARLLLLASVRLAEQYGVKEIMRNSADVDRFIQS